MIIIIESDESLKRNCGDVVIGSTGDMGHSGESFMNRREVLFRIVVVSLFEKVPMVICILHREMDSI